ncbi:hypothetical protein FQN60_011841 [Etheostoma spectabile]|uniref:Uncharacterized protein n=1 Tax=Etheostoma spectabile TaxID=54343 RepID=A0A5J5DN08_9PERO|nr:hypothetical protein FQN60_011841 [Etheostoma spectabile]
MHEVLGARPSIDPPVVVASFLDERTPNLMIKVVNPSPVESLDFIPPKQLRVSALSLSLLPIARSAAYTNSVYNNMTVSPAYGQQLHSAYYPSSSPPGFGPGQTRMFSINNLIGHQTPASMLGGQGPEVMQQPGRSFSPEGLPNGSSPCSLGAQAFQSQPCGGAVSSRSSTHPGFTYSGPHGHPHHHTHQGSYGQGHTQGYAATGRLHSSAHGSVESMDHYGRVSPVQLGSFSQYNSAASPITNTGGYLRHPTYPGNMDRFVSAI